MHNMPVWCNGRVGHYGWHDRRAGRPRPGPRPHLLRPDTGVDEAVLDDCVQKGYVAALGVGMQGIFTLTPVITPLCFLHWGGAAIFAGAAQAHATTAIEAYEKAIASTASPVGAQSPPLHPHPRPRSPSFVARSATQLPFELEFELGLGFELGSVERLLTEYEYSLVVIARCM